MRIICENCGTKYSIADEKVRGKVFKIRCKKCGHIIVVKGAQEQAAPAAEGGFDEKETRVFDYSGFSDEQQGGGEEAGWHVVIDREQVGPLTDEQVRQKFAAGEIDVETFIWREGFADWVKLGGVEEFSDLEDATVAAQSPFSEGAAAPFGGMAASPAVTAESSPPMESEQADVQEPESAASFSAGTEEAGGGLFGSPSHEDASMASAPQTGSSELFGSPAPSGGNAPAAGGGHSLFPEEEEDDSPQPAMTGQRNENSVLFSLSNLQSLATGGGSARSSGLGGGGARPGAGIASAKSEGSGLLDIRAMAASTLGDGSADSEGVGISVPSPFSSPMASPVLMPVAASDRPGWLIPVLALGGVLLIAVLVLGVVVVIRMGDDKTPPKQEEIAKGVEKETPAVVEKDKEEQDTERAKEEGEEEKVDSEEAKADTEKTDDAEDDDASEAAKIAAKARAAGRTPSTAPSSRRPPAKTKDTSTTTTRPSTPTTTPSARKSSAADDPLASLLGASAAPKKKATEAAKPKPAPSGKESLTAGDIRSAMGSIRGAVRRCYDKFKVTGRVNVSVTVAGSNGRVKSATVSGQFSGTPTGNCVAAAVRSAKFPSFSRPSQTFTYPFLLN